MTTTYTPQPPATAEFLDRAHPLFIGGEWTRVHSQLVVDPATGDVGSRVQGADAADVDRAVAGARAAFDDGPWPRLSPLDRAGVMLKLADLIDCATPEIAYLETSTTSIWRT